MKHSAEVTLAITTQHRHRKYSAMDAMPCTNNVHPLAKLRARVHASEASCDCMWREDICAEERDA
eukprot:6455110-Amphidinium_carterae.1